MLICLLPCCVKAFEVLIAALHHAVIDIAQPVRLCQGEDETGAAEGREMNRRIEMHFVTPDNDGTKCESNYVQ